MASTQNGTPADTRVAFDFQAAIGYPLTLHLSPWQSATPFAWESRVDGELVTSGAFLSPLGIGWEMIASTHGETLMAGMPESVRAVIRIAPFLGVELAQVCGELSAARELAVSSPLLLILLVEHGVQEAWTPEMFERLLAKPQALQCAAVGLPQSKAYAKLLRRCVLWPMIPRDVRELTRPLLRVHDVALLRHQAPLNLAHLLFLARYEGERWPGLLALVDETLEGGTPRPGAHIWLKRMITDTARMLPATPQALYRVHTIARLQALHDRQIQRFNADLREDGGQQSAAELQHRHGLYPSPPLAGTETITPITSWQALLREGQCMGHCVGSYDRSVARKNIAIYHMDFPQALTIAIAPQGKRWILTEARGVRNAMPLGEAQEAIQVWLNKQKLK